MQMIVRVKVVEPNDTYTGHTGLVINTRGKTAWVSMDCNARILPFSSDELRVESYKAGVES